MSDSIAANIATMNKLEGFDVIILCCGSGLQADYWQGRLERGKGSVLPANALVLAVEEDWPGGAGNALGTLYAYKNACTMAKEKFSYDVEIKLKRGEISVGLFHTAGKGTRLAPLPGAENNNKPGVKLPATVTLDIDSESSTCVPVTILEAVIKQTCCYGKSRAGRLSVFWGDQVFIPTVPVEYKVSHHVDILCSLGPMMDEKEWREKGMDKYGLIACSSTGAAQVEKVDHSTAVQLLSGLGEIKSVGASLGSFSVSSVMLYSLLAEFREELAAKKGKLDSDPHLWMPMTLTKSAYLQLMGQKGVSSDAASAHYDRIASMMLAFDLAVKESGSPAYGLFGPVDVGAGVYWWDYGQLKLYQKNSLLMLEDSREGQLMRTFFGLKDVVQNSSVRSGVVVDRLSCLSSCEVGESGTISTSVLSNVRCNHIEADGAILINVTAKKIIAPKGCIVYNVVDESPDGLVLSTGQVYSGVFNLNGQQILMRSHVDIDGGKAWETALEGNAHSFEGIYNMNTTVSPVTLEQVITAAHRAVQL